MKLQQQTRGTFSHRANPQAVLSPVHLNSSPCSRDGRAGLGLAARQWRWVLSTRQGSKLQLAFQLLCCQGALDGFAAWVEHRVGTLLSLLPVLRGSGPYIHPVEQGQDKISQAKFQLHKQSQEDQPEKNLQEGDVGQERLVPVPLWRNGCAPWGRGGAAPRLSCFLGDTSKHKSE